MPTYERRPRAPEGAWRQAEAPPAFVLAGVPSRGSAMSPVRAVLALLAALAAPAAAYFVSIDAHAEECFLERVPSGTKMGLIFEVAEGGFLDIDVEVRRGGSGPARPCPPTRGCPGARPGAPGPANAGRPWGWGQRTAA